MKVCTSFGTIDIGRELRDIAVHLQDAVLRPHPFDQYRIVGLDPFSDKAMPWWQEEVLRHLLGDRACTAHWPVRVALVSFLGVLDLDHVKTMMLKEPLILRGNDRRVEIRGDLASGKICVGPDDRFSCKEMIEHPEDHHTGNRWVDELQRKDLKYWKKEGK